MPTRGTRLQITGMCAEGTPAYSEIEMTTRYRMRREAALTPVGLDRTYCRHYSSIREILSFQDLADKIERYSEGALTHLSTSMRP